MKQFAVAVLLLVSLTVIGCGYSNRNAGSINGTWNATLLSNGNSTNFNFGTSLTETGNGSITFVNFNFTSSSPCFANGETETGSFTLSGNYNGQVNGTFGMTIQASGSAPNTLVLNGTAAGNTISGNWTLAGSPGCTGSGTFVMTRM